MEARKNHALDAPADIRPAPDPALTADDILKAAQDMVPPSPGPSRHPEHQAEGRRRRGRCRPLAELPRP